MLESRMRVYYLFDRVFPRSYVAKFLAVTFVAICLPLLTVTLLFVMNPAASRGAFFVDLFVTTVVGFAIMGLLIPRLLVPLEMLLELLEDGSPLADTDTLSQDISGKLLRRTSEVLTRMRSSEQRYTALFHAIPDGITCFNRQGDYTEVKLPSYFSYVQPDLIGKTPEDLYSAETAATIRKRRECMWETGEMQTYELERTVNGQISHREVCIFPLSDNEGAALVRDISERKQAQQRLQESESRFRSFFESSPNPCLMLESDGLEVVSSIFTNQALQTFLGGLPSNITTMQSTEILAYIESISHPEDWQQDAAYLSEVSAGNRDGYRMEKRYLHPDGTWRWGDYSCTAIRDEQGNIARILATIQDITKQKEAELALRESENRYRLLAENSQDLIGLNALDGTFIYASPAFERLLGYRQEDLLASPPQQLIHPDDADVGYAAHQATLAGQSVQVEYRLRKKDGTYLWVESNASLVDDNVSGEKRLLATSRDITERKQVQAQLQDTLSQLEASEAKFRVFFEGSGSAHSIINMRDPDTPRDDRLLVNRAYEHLMADTIVADTPVRTLADITILNDALTHPKDLVVETAHNQALVSGQRDNYKLEKRFLKRDGEVIWVVVTHSLIRQADGNPDLLLSTIQDITDLKRTQNHLSQTLGKLEDAIVTKNMLMRETHHRVKNNLQVIASLLNLQSHLLSDETAKEALSESRKRVMAMAEIHELMHQSDASNRIDFAQYLEELIALMKRSYGLDDIVIQLELMPVTLPLDQAIPLALIANELVSNALKYAFPETTDSHKRPTISIFLHQTDSTVTLCVDDNGVGLAETDKEKDSLGMTIIKSLSGQLGGTLTFADKITHRQLPIAESTLHDTPPDETGLQVTLCFPIENLQEA